VKIHHLFDATVAAVQANPTRPATAIVHDSDQARLVVFRIEPGQQVAPHVSTSAVMLVALSGSGILSGADGEQPVRAGDLATYDPGELHGMRAGNDTLALLAIIAPRPGARP
jgi:quercetin dioxygenase-like cupin family protein